MYSNETCLDYNECKKELSTKLSEGYITCGHGAFCSNNVGGFACTCRYGFKVEAGMNGINESNKANTQLFNEITTCVDIDECTKQTVCPENAECQNTEGSYSCNCFEGFQGDYCTDVDECNKTNSCDFNAKCQNTDGSYMCSCKQGYYGTGSWCTAGRCLDANCPESQKCVSATTVNCECKEGFRFNSFSVCNYIDECSEIKCGDESVCSNTIGSYTCSESINSTNTFTNATLVSSLSYTEPPTVLATQTSSMTKRPIPTSFK